MCILKLIAECSNCVSLRSLKQIHAHIITSDLVRNKTLTIKVAQLLARSLEFSEYACKFFSNINSNSFPFNTVISGYAASDTPQAAFLVYKRLVQYGFSANMFTFPVVLKSCSKFKGIEEGTQVHGVVVKLGFLNDLYIYNSLVHFYSACGRCAEATKVFDNMLERDVVSWTSLISGYVTAGLFREALSLFLKMDTLPNAAAFVSLLVACGKLGCLNMGKCIHKDVLKRGFDGSLVVNNALLDMYVKFECLNEAKQLFHELPDRDIVSWTCVITGLVQCRFAKEALEMFREMQVSGVELDKVILTSLLSACASLGALHYGRWVHEYADQRGMRWDVHAGTAMVDMYAKCGCIDMALKTFHGMSSRNVFTWNVMLSGLAMHGRGHEALDLFEQMIRAGTRPNHITFLALLTACCHSGLVEEGQKVFYQMTGQEYNLSPKLEHYGCLVDLLCRAGLVMDALVLVRSMPMPPDVLIWGALLSTYNTIGNEELPQDLLNQVHRLKSQDSGVRVLLSNIYATNERWEDVTSVRRLMKEKCIQKAAGSSVIEVDGKLHEFLVGDTRHHEDIHILVNTLACQEHTEVQSSHLLA